MFPEEKLIFNLQKKNSIKKETKEIETCYDVITKFKGDRFISKFCESIDRNR